MCRCHSSACPPHPSSPFRSPSLPSFYRVTSVNYMDRLPRSLAQVGFSPRGTGREESIGPAHTFISRPFVKLNLNDSCLCAPPVFCQDSDTVFSTYAKKKFASWGLGGMHLCMLTALESCTESANGGASRKWWLGSGSRIEGNYLIVYFFFPF